MSANEIERMARMWNVEGLSMGQIAERMKMTRNMVSGLIYRHRAMFKRRNQAASNWRDVKRGRVKPSPAKPREPIVTASQQANARRSAFHAVKVAEEAATAPVEQSGPISKEEAEAYDAARRPFSKDLMTIRDCECKWWVSDGPMMFCAEEVVAGKSWCKHHLKRSKGKGTASEQKAVSDLRRAA